ncbi:MAG: glycosyltransferase family 4 protein [Patescibacteria group bacterium]|nr:glycosyltransferase family 4 protein [Patescibacteria group bacterium]
MKLVLATGIYPPDIGGPATYCYHFAEEFSRRGIAVSVVTYGESSEQKQYPVRPVSRRIPQIIRQAYYGFMLMREARGADGIIAFDSLGAGLPAMLAGKIRRIPVVMRLGGDFVWEKYIERGGVPCTMREFYERKRYRSSRTLIALVAFVLRRVTMVVFTTSFQRELFVRYYRLERSRTAVRQNVFVKKIGQAGGASSAGLLWAGRFLKLKNISFLIEVYRYVRVRAKRQAQLVLVGDGPEKESIAQEIRKRGLQKEVRLADTMSPSELAAAIRKAYCGILPSLTEISPNFALECVSEGVPAVITAETGIREMLPELLYADPRSVQEFGDAVVRLIDDGDFYRAYIRRIAGIRYHKSWEEAADEYLALFHSLSNV